MVFVRTGCVSCPQAYVFSYQRAALEELLIFQLAGSTGGRLPSTNLLPSLAV